MIVYAATGFLISLYGEDDDSAAATALVKARPVFILTPFGEAEFTNAVELRAFLRQWTRREARAVHEGFLHHQGAGVFRMERSVPRSGKRHWFSPIAIQRDSVLEPSTFSTWRR